MVGTNRALNPERYFIILTNLLANGRSSSPSNTPAPFERGRFPKITYHDNVRLRHSLVTERLGLKVSRISDEEMKALMIKAVNRVFTFLVDPALCINSLSMRSGWNKPMVDEEFQQGFKMLAARIGGWLRSE